MSVVDSSFLNQGRLLGIMAILVKNNMCHNTKSAVCSIFFDSSIFLLISGNLIFADHMSTLNECHFYCLMLTPGSPMHATFILLSPRGYKYMVLQLENHCKGNQIFIQINSNCTYFTQAIIYIYICIPFSVHYELMSS